jgi:hypothetical protein
MKKISNKSTHRLPTTIIPSHYRLYIDVSQLEQFIFCGTVDIDVQVKYFKIYKKINIEKIF